MQLLSAFSRPQTVPAVPVTAPRKTLWILNSWRDLMEVYPKLQWEKDYGVKMARFTVADSLNNKVGNEAWTTIGKIFAQQK